jgi:ATP-dependent RNA helicase RhlE
LCEPEENAFIRDIERLINQKINLVKENPFPQTEKPMTENEKKEWEKEKQRKKQEYFASRDKKQSSVNSSQSYRKRY